MTTIERLLHRTSRSFALSIPAAPAPLDEELRVGYLLFRIGDTFEDCTHVDVQTRVAGLHALVEALAAPRDMNGRATLRRHAEALPVEHEGYRELMDSCELVFDALLALRPAAAKIIATQAARTASECIRWVRGTGADGVLRLQSMEELREYCYGVAGIPGEMLCELFLLDRPALEHVATGLRARAVTFGEAMQLVNILKDVDEDASEGRVYLPSSVSTSEALALARADLAIAREYVELLRQPGVEAGVVAFHAITTGLAEAALEVTEVRGPGAKISRRRVARVLQGAGLSYEHVLG